MSLVFRRHLSHSQAHILAGVLASGGISCVLVGDLTAQLYGGTTVLDCVVLVSEDDLENAEIFVRSDFSNELIDEPTPPEQRPPPNADPPGIGDMMPASALIFSAYFIVTFFLAGIAAITSRSSPEGVLHQTTKSLFLNELPLLIVGMLIHAIGAGLLLKIIRGYRHGSPLCRGLVKALLIVLIHILSQCPLGP